MKPDLASDEASPAPERSADVPLAVAGAFPELGEGASRPRAPLWATLIATFFGIGRLRPGPGTWASAATVAIWATAAY